MIWYIVCTTFVLFFCVPDENWTSEVRINIIQGTVIGTYDFYYKFYGIPYADSTSGVNRFQPPKPVPPFEAPFVANRQNITCLRPTRDGYDGIEDCLTLDVVFSTVDHTRKLPVMVWIKGREPYNFQLSIENIIEKDIIVVTPNYRESIFGFLCLGTSKAPGNAGLKDIIAALKWIQQNIAAFGGDPQNVTIFGHDSGAAIVDLLTLSISSKGLFTKAIAQSDNTMAPWVVSKNNLHNAINVAEALGHDVDDIERLSDILTRVSASALMAVINELETDNLLTFAPCTERVIANDLEPFLLKSPYQILASWEQLEVLFMTGFLDNEGTVETQKDAIKDWFSIINLLDADLYFDRDDERQKVTEQIKEFYFLDNSSEKDIYVTFSGDELISTLRESHIRVLSSTVPIYRYQFSYKGHLGRVLEDAYFSKEVVNDMLVERWTNFAKSGTPSSETSNTKWQPFTKHNTYYLRILNNNDPNKNEADSLDIVLKDPYLKTMEFWQDIDNKYFLDARSRIIHKALEKDSVEVTDNDLRNNRTESIENMDDNYKESNKTDNEYHDSNSTSTLIGYTLVVVSLLSIVNNLEISEIML